MSFIPGTPRSDGYVVPATVWNQDVVENPIALKALIDAIVAGGKFVCNGRLSLTTGVPVTTADVTAATTLYWVPYQGNQVALYTGSAWTVVTQAQLSIAVPATTNKIYDVFLDYNGGTPVLAVTAWTNDTTRATALTTQDGVLVQTGNLDWRYLGSFRTDTVSGQTTDSLLKRFVWNYYNRVDTELRLTGSGTWNYTTNTFRQANASTANQLALVIGVSEDAVNVALSVGSTNTVAATPRWVGIGLDSTTTPSGTVEWVENAAATQMNGSSEFGHVPAAGYHFYAWLERSIASGTTAWLGASAPAQYGMTGRMRR